MSTEQRVMAPPVFNAAAVMAEFDGDVEFVQQLAELINASVPRYVDEMHRACDAADWQGVARAAHSVRGSVANAYATRLDGISRSVEDFARAGGPVPLALITELDEAASELLSVFVRWADTVSDGSIPSSDLR